MRFFTLLLIPHHCSANPIITAMNIPAKIKLIFILSTVLTFQSNVGQSQDNQPLESNLEAPDFDASKLKSATLTKWGGFALGAIGSATLSVPIAIVGGIIGIAGQISQDVQLVRLGNRFAQEKKPISRDGYLAPENYLEFNIESVVVGSSGTYKSSKKASNPFMVMEILDEIRMNGIVQEKIILIQYTYETYDNYPRRAEKRMNATNLKLKFLEY